ncbi:hypothetical protein COLO4_17014 [Corchorus olitorius]|uniref:Uncharacterized protein n=1 Tax=Corchorus olitorius TaxID=93759 RepID=A0A1R3JEM1_9ROSI|nr:hypothetical protein COLO4_17014 [Corchorus olitorius]
MGERDGGATGGRSVVEPILKVGLGWGSVVCHRDTRKC